MKHRALPLATALAATAALLLTACGGGSDKPSDDDQIAGAETNDTKTSASPNASASISRPDLSLPSDVKEVFEGWSMGDEDKDAALADAGRSMTAVNRAITDSQPDSAALKFYYEGEALVGAAKWVQTFVDHDATITGTTRYYSPTVNMSGKKTAAVTLCADESKAFNKFRKTGKVDRSAPSDDSYVYYLSRLKLNDTGVWVTTEVHSQRGSAKCTP
ncbi:hypothetical protein ACFY3N_27185 [Streptomyces sp. NPDC000348]|uniref:hypothetical protein n=1 Tax=Streptomyces sp. NPDC000348 TaxID=3364538 RepID=UPI00369D4439